MRASIHADTIRWVSTIAFMLAMVPAWTGTTDAVLKAQLVWATDQAKPKPEFKELDKKLGDKLRKMFKWKNYFEISRQEVNLPASGSRKVRMSQKCELELRLSDDGSVEVKLFGEGKLVKTIRQPLKPLQKGEYAAIGGDDKDSYGDAWFVVLSADQR